ncbi:MAG: DUF4012 domain-containing protein [Ktedonobacteraceae bacterium]
MPGVRVKNSLKFTGRMRDIASWQQGDITSLSSREKKRYHKRKSAIEEYFKTEASIDEIARRHHLSPEIVLELAEKCLMQHEDGGAWGFRALLPGVAVIDHAPQPALDTLDTSDVSEESKPPEKDVLDPGVDTSNTCSESCPPAQRQQSAMLIEETADDEDTAKRRAVKPPPLTPVLDMDVPETPRPSFMKDEDEEEEHATASLGTEVSDGSNVTDLGPLVLPLPIKNGIYIANKRAIQRRSAYKRWQRGIHDQQKHRHTLRIARLVIVAAMFVFVLLPAGAGVAAYSAYNNINAMAHDGLNHLLKVKSLLNVSKSDPTAALNATKLQQAQVEFKEAEVDFVQLQQLVDRPDIQGAITQFSPQYGSKLGEVVSLVQVALDVSRMGDELSGVGLIGANIIHASPLTANSNKPLISASDVLAIEGAMVHALYYISDIRAQMSHISLKDLPISNSQKTQLASLLPLLPKAQDMIVQAQGLVGLVTWLLGVGQPRRFLIQTMDRAELRPGGGFTGQYGIVQIQDGRVTPPSLTDVTLLDYAGNGTAIGRRAPNGYSWMNFGNWGIRDSNLSGDFPTTARMTMQLFQDEGGGPVDGDIAFTPSLIGHILDVTGPIKVPGYNETITSKNLEERLHYYQQDYSAIAREKQISGNYSKSGRKAFTSTLGKILLDRVRHLPVKQLMEVVKGAIKDIQSHDLQIYFTNPAVEGWLVQHGYSGSTDTFSKQDGFTVVQANISISKASQYVHTTEHDDVTLDAQGGAKHNLTITLNYQQKGPVYGYDTYADYIRIYAPQNAQFISGDGFDSGHALCTPGTPKPSPGSKGSPPTTSGCGQYNGYFPSAARYCPNGNYTLGMRGFTLNGTSLAWPVDSLGPPTALTSDLPGRAMWGGMTETPKNCISTITVSWYVPHAVKKVNGQPTYTILVQKQAGYIPTIELAIDASAIKGLKNFTFKGAINADRYFVLAVPPNKKK